MSPAAKEPDQSTYGGRFAARLRTLREKAGLTIDQFIEKVAQSGYKVGKSTAYHWESGRTDPPLDAFPAIATALGLKTVRRLLPVY